MNNQGHYSELKKRLHQKNQGLKEKLITSHGTAFEWLNSNVKQLAAGAFGSVLLLTAPAQQALHDSKMVSEQKEESQLPSNRMFLINELQPYLPSEVDVLSQGQEGRISEILSNYYDIKVMPEIDGKRLLHTYGYIGAEQHLMRYPGDTMESHFDNPEDANKYYSSGMAPGRGAWGYFANSRAEMTQEDVDREKYYIAVQTFLAPDYVGRLVEYRDFFKYRKMLVVNPHTGRAMVVVIGDAGPAVWTKKHLGGSPEVMKYLERQDGRAKRPVLYFFIDDPENKIPLGPIDPKGGEFALK